MKLYYITGRGNRSFSWLREKILSLAPYVDYIQVREKTCPARDLFYFLSELLEDWSFTARVLVNARLDVALACRAHGVHLPSDDLPLVEVRKNVPSSFLVFQSTHSLSEAMEALQKGADFVTLSPFFPTPSKPDAKVLPLSLLSEVPPGKVFALGGITGECIHQVARYPIAGIAGIRLFQDSPLPFVKSLRQEYNGGK